MNFSEYMPLALRTAKQLPHDQQVKHAILGLITEVGELADNVKRFVIGNKAFDAVNMMEECADCFWYLCLYMHEQHLGGKLVDDVWEDTKDEFLKLGKRTEDPWDLVDLTMSSAALAAALFQPAKDRGVSDREVAATLALGLSTFLLYAGYTLSDALTKNIDKLALRHGDKFKDYADQNRDIAATRAILEGGTS